MINNCQNQLLFVATLCLLCFNKISTKDVMTCTLSNLNQCGPNETCEQRSPNNGTGVCTCMKGYYRPGSDKECILKNSTPSPDVTTMLPDPSSVPVDNSNSHIVVGVMVPLVLIFLALGVVYAAQRYQWVQRIRAMRQRRYDEVQFGQDDDDPPLA